MTYEALDGWLDPALRLTVAGEAYVFPVPSARHVIELRRVLAHGAATVTVEQEQEQADRLAGPDLTERLLDVPEATRRHILRTALIHYGIGEDVAVAHWRAGPVAGKLLGAMESETSAPPARTAETTPAAGRTTRRRASASGTTPRKKAPRESPGRKS